MDAARSSQVSMKRVIDGDTVVVIVNQGLLRKPQETRIRLYGIDAPESSQKGGKESTQHLRKLIGARRKIWMDTMSTDQYGRTVGLIYPRRNHPEDSYNLHMVEAGQARCYMTGAQDHTRYQQAETHAKEKNRGLWKQRKRVDPWQYRKDEKKKSQRHTRIRIILVLVLASAIMAAAFTIQNDLFRNLLPNLFLR